MCQSASNRRADPGPTIHCQKKAFYASISAALLAQQSIRIQFLLIQLETTITPSVRAVWRIRSSSPIRTSADHTELVNNDLLADNNPAGNPTTTVARGVSNLVVTVNMNNEGGTVGVK